MKKVLFAVFAILIMPCILLMSGCTVDLAGTWKLSKINFQMSGVKLEFEVGDLMGGVTIEENFMILEFNDDGTCNLSVASELEGSMEVTANVGTWKRENGKIILNFSESDSTVSYEGTVDGNEFTFSATSSLSTVSFVLVRE